MPETNTDLYQGDFNAYGKQPTPAGEGEDVTNLVIADLENPDLREAARRFRVADLYESYLTLIALAYDLRLKLSDEELGNDISAENPHQVFRALQADLLRRAIGGEKKYGTKLKTFNGRSAVLDELQEVYDAIMYNRQELQQQLKKSKEGTSV
ncbi:MAG: hypothetical protein JWQ87_2025 [Candidatus Sulfotelmatobacter sp.]|nr:hypothetical protein [Candidatus Sulfotelmatobacter sp.]